MMVLMFSAASANDGDEKVEWLSYENVRANSQGQMNKVFLYFYSDNCGYCRLLEDNTFKNTEIIQYLNHNYTPVRINTDRETKTARRFQIRGVPDLRFLSSEGEPIARWPGYIEADHLLTLLKYVKTDSYLKMSYGEFIKQQ